MSGDVVEVRVTDVCFVHWPVSADEVAERLPAGTNPDVRERQAWLSVVGMVVRPRFLPTTQGYAQLTVRTYLSGEPPAIHFLDVIADKWLAVQGEQFLTGVPSRYGHVTVARAGDRVRVRSVAVDDIMDFDVVPSGEPTPLENGTLGHWLVERPRFVRDDGSGAVVDRPPWRLQRASGEVGARSLLDRLPETTGDPVFHYSPGLVFRV